jgi:uncharacterized SAM-binding protein YcdF (DUF218 family)
MRRALTIALLLVGIGAGAWLERQALLRGLADLWIVSDPVTHGDAVVVLGGSFNWRPFVAADLYQKGLVSKVLISQVEDEQPAVKIGVLPEHTELNRKVLLKLGVPDTSIELFGTRNNSTEDEARALKVWAEQNAVSVLIIPTEPFFTRRTRGIFHREFYGTDVRIEISSFGTENTWTRKELELRVILEVLKYISYRLKY